MDSAKAVGARVIRSQTLGDSIGCPECIEPKLGDFNPDGFKHIDYAIKAAHDRGLRFTSRYLYRPTAQIHQMRGF